ncbi:pentatricopeptide repeat-containing protein At3g18110, chloroplastic [Phoenix dactylifera]|uniref:Pentatricopeptide repeat-containing protein At3g18110, chloroplastic n=1 Tax=Phoenix dactylifera TaxID=42345 RepID=A0A8B9AM58_PHODC|nr:pentatricopeptide repeat-containing protein At3g18110, chloroplastic [Phoenix dactylifera]XP_038987455.1 pentatricopeptide repeat-containing protein At3g18110, chloroplastic [Phoenix dactylifera]XP_038987456.1 pentatricopeptide repeat-containing protein At3g18110, chloroplastic [Phoenix dactylifera]XP_038987457.1 pentatricopeptide repeat-containing protein At3g18110, chloroplastic [Phoenix dactylifera]XP_038987458.1 pentatricopeptide repeat-containing protein At3g18110, chloroplastic [Phoeni
MPLMALAGPPLPLSAASPSSRLPAHPNLRRTVAAATATTSTSSTTEDHSKPREFQYSRADPSVRWPNLKLDHSFHTQFPSPSPPVPTPNLPSTDPHSPKTMEEEPPETLGEESTETLDRKQFRTRSKKMSKLALQRARDWRQRVQLLTDRILALPPSALVADVLDHRGVQMTPTDLAFVVKWVGRHSWARALEVFEWLTLRRRHAPGPRLLAITISVLGRAHQDALAEEVFHLSDTGEPSVQVFNAMMGVYARTGRFAEVQELLNTMRDRGLEPDLVSFNTLINARAKAESLPPGSALELLQEVRRSGLRPDTITYNTLISACSRGAKLEEAMRVFEDMEASRCQPDLWTYNAMVSVYGRRGMTREVARLFRELGEKGFLPDAVTYNSLLFAYAKQGNVEMVERVCKELVDAGFKKDEITYNIIIHMYGKKGRLDLALQLYDDMKSNGCAPDAVTYTVLIDSLGKVDRITEAGKVMSEMVDAGVRPTLRTFSALICGYAKAGMRVEAERTFDHMVRSGIKPDRLAYSVMLDVFLRSNEIRKAMASYRAMMRDGFWLDNGLYEALLGVLVQANKDEEIEEVIKDMEEVCMMCPQVILALLVKGKCFVHGAEVLKRAVSQGKEFDHDILLAIVDAYVASERQTEALALLEFLREHAPNANHLITEASIMMLCKNQQMEAAIEEYNNMRMLGFGSFGRNSSLFEYLITCCEEAGLLSEASQLFSDMKFLGLEPSQKIYESMVNIYCKMRFPETAYHLVDQAEKAGISFSDLSTYIILIETFGKLKLWQKAESFVWKLRQISAVDRKIWNALIYAYAESGRYEQARAVFNMMMKNGPSPSVDSVNGLMQALIVDGRLDELYVVVQELQDMDFKISKSTVLTMLDAFVRAGNIFEVKKIYNGMKAAGYLPTLHMYRSMIGLLSRGKRVRDVEMMVAEMEEAGFKPDLTIFNSLLKMYTAIEDFKKTLETYQSIQEAGFKADEVTYNTLMVMYSRDRRPEEGFTLLNEMRKQGCEPKLNTYKSLLAACGKEQLWEQAEELFESMRSKGYRLDRSFYHIMMKIYRNSGNHSKAEHLLSLMKKDGIEPTIATMHMLMVSYGTAGQPQEAENVLNNLKSSGLDLSTLPYSSVIDAYLKNGDYNLGIMKLLEMKRDGVEPDHRIWTCFIRAASLCEKTNEAMVLLNSLSDTGFDLPIRLLTEKAGSLVMEVDHLLEELGPMEDNASFNFVNALEDLLWAYERRATASWIFQLAIKKSIYRHDVFRVAEKDWGADFRKLSAGAALVGLTLWLDHMQDASLHGSPESPKSVVLITGTAEYNMVSLNNTLKAYLWEMGSPFLPCKTRSGVLVAKAHSLRMWLKDSSFCMDLELKDALSLPESNSMKLTEGYFMRAGLVPAFKDIHERLGEVRPKKFARLALLPGEKRDKVIKADIEGREEKLHKLKKKGAVRARKPTRLRTGKFMRRQHKTEKTSN